MKPWALLCLLLAGCIQVRTQDRYADGPYIGKQLYKGPFTETRFVIFKEWKL